MIDLPAGSVVLEPRDAELLARALRLLIVVTERRDGGQVPGELVRMAGRFDRAVREALAAAGVGDEEARELRGPQLPATPQPRSGSAGAASSHDLDAQTAAELLGCTDSNVRALAQRGTLPGWRVGRCWRFAVEDVVEYRDRRKVS